MSDENEHQRTEDGDDDGSSGTTEPFDGDHNTHDREEDDD